MLAEQRSRNATADGLHATSTGRRTLVIVWLCGVLWAVGAAAQPARAQSSPSGDEPLREMGSQAPASGDRDEQENASDEQPPLEALELFNLARAHYQAGRYEQALTYLSRALEQDPGSLDLLYNIARVHELLGNLDDAMGYYQRYLDRLPKSAKKERKHTRDTLKRLRGAREHMVARDEQAEGGVEASAPPGRADWLFWTTATGSVLLAGSGVFAAVVASNKDDTVQQYVLGPDGGPVRRDAIASNARAWALTADILFLSAGVAAATTALLYFLRDAEAEGSETARAPRLGVAVAAQGRGAVLTWSGSL